MRSLPFPDYLRNYSRILGEGAVIERLRRDPTTVSDASPQDWPTEVRGRGLVVSERIVDRWMTQFVANMMPPSVSETFH
jgi:hypothetical protein